MYVFFQFVLPASVINQFGRHAATMRGVATSTVATCFFVGAVLFPRFSLHHNRKIVRRGGQRMGRYSRGQDGGTEVAGVHGACTAFAPPPHHHPAHLPFCSVL